MAYGEFAAWYDRMMTSVDYDRWGKYLVELIRLYAPTAKPTLLDAACGTGNLTLRFAKAGYPVIGSDLSEEMLSVAQQKARDACLSIPFIRQDLCSIQLHRPVDVINCACDGVNYLQDEEALLAFFTAAHAALTAGGLLLFDVSSAYKLEHILGDRAFCDEGEDWAYLCRNAFDSKSRRIQMDLSCYVREGALYRRFTERHWQCAFERAVLTAALKAAGFEPLVQYGDFGKKDAEATAERIQFAARKKERTNG